MAPVRITNQFRRRQSMVYDLASDDVRLTIEITPRDNGDGRGEWTVGAHTRATPDQPAIDEPGATRGDALQAAGRAWAAKQGATGFPLLDWEALTQALLAVRAI